MILCSSSMSKNFSEWVRVRKEGRKKIRNWKKTKIFFRAAFFPSTYICMNLFLQDILIMIMRIERIQLSIHRCRNSLFVSDSDTCIRRDWLTLFLMMMIDLDFQGKNKPDMSMKWKNFHFHFSFAQEKCNGVKKFSSSSLMLLPHFYRGE